jgi:hypothetical protein
VDVGRGHNTKLGWLPTRHVRVLAQRLGSRGLLYSLVKELVRRNSQVAAMLKSLEAHFAAGEQSPWLGRGLVVPLDVGEGGGGAGAGAGAGVEAGAGASSGQQAPGASWLPDAWGEGPVDLEELLAKGLIRRVL